MTIDKPNRIQWEGRVGNMRVAMYGKNFKTCGSDRGGSIKSLEGKPRTEPCHVPFNMIYLDWNGNVMPCCNLRSDIKNHESYILGNVNESSLADCVFNERACNFRREMMTTDEKKGACKTCNFGTETTLVYD